MIRIIIFIIVVILLGFISTSIIAREVTLTERIAVLEEQSTFLRYCEDKGHRTYLVERKDLNEYYLKCTK
jgi:hypothetical protein